MARKLESILWPMVSFSFVLSLMLVLQIVIKLEKVKIPLITKMASRTSESSVYGSYALFTNFMSPSWWFRPKLWLRFLSELERRCQRGHRCGQKYQQAEVWSGRGIGGQKYWWSKMENEASLQKWLISKDIAFAFKDFDLGLSNYSTEESIWC